MLNDLRDILARSSGTLIQDAIGIGAIGVMMTVGLFMPQFF